MKQYTINLLDEEEKALLACITDVQEWIQHAIKNKARQCIDRIITETGQGSKFTPVETKLEIIRNLDLETRVERDAREKAELEGE
jgi:hypothetical protein